MAEPYGQLGRVLAGFVLLALLGGCFFVAGATSVELMESEHPDQMDVRHDRAAYVGDRVLIGGFVVETDPVVVATLASGHGRFTLVGVDDQLVTSDGPLEDGDRVNAFGTLEDESTLVVERAVTRDRSDAGYLFLVSIGAALWLAGRFVRQWRVDLTAVALVPRGPSRSRSRSPSSGDPRGRGDGYGSRPDRDVHSRREHLAGRSGVDTEQTPQPNDSDRPSDVGPDDEQPGRSAPDGGDHRG